MPHKKLKIDLCQRKSLKMIIHVTLNFGLCIFHHFSMYEKNLPQRLKVD